MPGRCDISAKAVDRVEKICGHCRVSKPLEQFYRNPRTGKIASWCRECLRVSRRTGKPKPFRDLTNHVYGQWRVLAYAGVTPQRKTRLWKAICSCGRERTVLASSLINNRSRSCGHERYQKCADRFRTLNSIAKFLGGKCLLGLSRSTDLSTILERQMNGAKKI